jgi:hypothetical protein
MKTFLQRFGGIVLGVLSGFDRLRLRGTRRLLAHVSGLKYFLWKSEVMLQHFDRYVQDTTATLCSSIQRAAEQAGRPLIYVPSSNQDKATIVQQVAQRDGIRQGLIAVLSCVEPCSSYEIHKNKHTHKLEPRRRERKCLHYYHYYLLTFRTPSCGLTVTK